MQEFAKRATRVGEKETDRGCQQQVTPDGYSWTACNYRPTREYFVPVLARSREMVVALCDQHAPEKLDMLEDLVEEDHSPIPQVREDDKPPFFSAAIYHVTQHYGGPEEGGWWYFAGDPDAPAVEPRLIIKAKLFLTAEEAMEYVKSDLTPVCEKRNEGLPPLTSVISRGRFEPRVVRGFPTPFPEETPHYE